MQEEKTKKEIVLNIFRWGTCVPAGLIIGVLAGWLIGNWHYYSWGEWLNDGFIIKLIIKILPESVTLVLTEIFIFLCMIVYWSLIGITSVYVSRAIAPDKKRVIASLVAGMLTMLAVIFIIVFAIGGNWLNAIATISLGIASIASINEKLIS